MRPSAAYEAGVEAGLWQADPLQREVLVELDRIHDELRAREDAGTLTRLARRLRGEAPVRGLYLWGGVGRGKTFLMDLFYSHLDGVPKRRVHYHRFMGEIHERLRALGEHADPLVQVAADCARQFRLLCLDEFFVLDIGDAMLLARLLDQLFSRGVTLVTTSNTAPENLYKDGLQRASFLPAIIQIQAHCRVYDLHSPRDYRLRALTRTGVWQTPANEAAEAALAAVFARLADNAAPDDDAALEINGRPIATRERADGVVWFDFAALCDGPRAVADYIEIARRFHTVLVSGIPVFDRDSEDPAYRFVLLVDELYDRGVVLVASAAAAPIELYRGRRVAREFERTVSRLTEMQSEEYLAQARAD